MDWNSGMSEYHVAILGGGSVGLCLAAHFAKAGARVTLLVRGASVPAFANDPVRIDGALGDHECAPGVITAVDAANPTDAVLASDALIPTVKAYDLADALKPLAAAGYASPLLLLQNGVGSAETARAVMGPDVPVYSSTMMIGMARTAPTHMTVTGQSGPILCGTLLGDDETPLQALLAVAQRGFVPMQHDPTIRETVYFKLLFNSCMNPTGALTGQTYGALLENPDSRALITDLAEETQAAYAAAFGYRPAESAEHYVDKILSGIVFPKAQAHQSSMFQDLVAGRQTEIDVLNGAVIRLAEAQGLPATRHRVIEQLIKAREATARQTAQA